MLRQEVAALLRADEVLPETLTGGIWPTADSQASALTRRTYPAAFDARGEVLPVALVQDDGMFALPTTRQTVSDTFRVLLWQQRGREALDAALARIFAVLQGARVRAESSWVYEIHFAGEGPSVRDQALVDAEHGWSRWQAVMIRA